MCFIINKHDGIVIGVNYGKMVLKYDFLALVHILLAHALLLISGTLYHCLFMITIGVALYFGMMCEFLTVYVEVFMAYA